MELNDENISHRLFNGENIVRTITTILGKYLPHLDHNGCLATKEHKVKDYVRDTICFIHSAIFQELQTLFKTNSVYRTFLKNITFWVRKFQKNCVWFLTLYAFIISKVSIRAKN